MSKTKCNLCGGQVLLGEGGVVGVDHEDWCPHTFNVDWDPDVPGAG